VRAPIEKGQKLARLQVLRDDSVIQETPLFAGAEVPVGALHSRAMDAVSELVTTFVRERVGLK
jgi:D-alanyl-D-alanine carboxypeptidase (penicillin-binding protein 5/6)